MSQSRLRPRSFAVILPLLAALLGQGLDSHLHAGAEASDGIQAEQHASHPIGEALEPGCAVCRSASTLRIAIVAGSACVQADRGSEPVLPVDGPPVAHSRLVRAAAPPRAPPA